ncbi:hypothetical protein [Jannaschia seohaensis]|uniref:Alpha-ketoglutarate-dependent 2,4-dichlorophenoxyacetate dioxygenase n=1 Tax=Jannaschia seohaensis TaxID=475081 RepID=A0A2Y9C962_9RHOB|nr:hypothetical protein [Jannaschia seohaensis]PWJ11182.1 alpha-ketoglutarate-dependent 2,4-dichlorophenoxyacetate dioxygenase [Jannaschia seohaensis]SSA51483.1 alpha-ketoglutarate-dependent 2,4-dichlorophenoxyacetate dioxygenase [Jannaschia seohaensis]
MTEETHHPLAVPVAPVEDRTADGRKPEDAMAIAEVSNVRADGSVTGEMDLHTLNLRSNFLWH